MQPVAPPSIVPLTSGRSAAPVAERIRAFLCDYSQLFKVRVTAMIVLTSWCGAYLASRYALQPLSTEVVGTLLAIAVVAAGSAAMNQVIERDSDSKMKRTAMRPLVTGRISFVYACATSLLMILGGTAYLAGTANWVCAALTLLTSALYLAAYTPLKKVSPICTTVGAIPGAMPVLLGWTAIRGRMDAEALALFAIVFFWQFPHFHAIALLYRTDYARAKIRMLPVVRPDGNATIRSILLNCFLLVPVSFLPAKFASDAVVYTGTAFLLGVGLLWFGLMLWRAHVSGDTQHGSRGARQLLLASVLYLPCLLILLMVTAP